MLLYPSASLATLIYFLSKESAYTIISTSHHLLGEEVGAEVSRTIEVASVIELSEASGRVAASLFMTEG